jgi:tight adherence protein C
MLIVFFLLTVILFSLFITLKIFEPRFKVEKRIDNFINIEKNNIRLEDDEIKKIRKINFNKVKDFIKPYIAKKPSSQNEEKIEMKLLQSGSPLGMRTIDFQVYKVIIKVVLTVLFFGYGKILNLGLGGAIFLAGIGFFFALILPNYYLNLKIKQRYKQALKELPDFLDLLTVCLEAGLGFDGALSKVISKRSGVLSSEFHICLEEIRLGKTRKEGLTGVRERLGFEEMKSLVNGILQGEKLGVSIVQILRVRSHEEREKRKQRAEEAAMKAPIKMMFPLVIFIFPSIFIVLLGPAVIQLLSGIFK